MEIGKSRENRLRFMVAPCMAHWRRQGVRMICGYGVGAGTDLETDVAIVALPGIVIVVMGNGRALHIQQQRTENRGKRQGPEPVPPCNAECAVCSPHWPGPLPEAFGGRIEQARIIPPTPGAGQRAFAISPSFRAESRNLPQRPPHESLGTGSAHIPGRACRSISLPRASRITIASGSRGGIGILAAQKVSSPWLSGRRASGSAWTCTPAESKRSSV